MARGEETCEAVESLVHYFDLYIFKQHICRLIFVGSFLCVWACIVVSICIVIMGCEVTVDGDA